MEEFINKFSTEASRDDMKEALTNLLANKWQEGYDVGVKMAMINMLMANFNK